MHLLSQMGVEQSCAKHLVPDHEVAHFLTLITCRYSRDFLSKLLRDDTSILPRESLCRLDFARMRNERKGMESEKIVSLKSNVFDGEVSLREEEGRGKMKQIYGNVTVVEALVGSIDRASAHAIRAALVASFARKGRFTRRARALAHAADQTSAEREERTEKKEKERKNEEKIAQRITDC